MTEAARPDLSQLFRPLPASIPKYPVNWVPRDPHEAWSGIRPSVGLTVIPPKSVTDLLPFDEAYGRFVENPDNKNIHIKTPRDPYVLLSLRREVQRVPPHPGIRPPEFNEFLHPTTVFYDASHSLFEARKFPQEYNPDRPWDGFHDFVVEVGHSSCPIELYDASYFFDFTSVLEVGFQRGQWITERIVKLLERRTAVEIFLVRMMGQGPICAHLLRQHFSATLPFINSLEIEEVKSWKSWADGRDAIGNTLRYVAEVLSMGRWLREIRDQDKGGAPVRASPAKYMGVWVGSVDSEETWTFLTRSSLPLYALLSVGSDHPLYDDAVTLGKGQTLSAGEEHRLDSFTYYLPFPLLRRDNYSRTPRPTSGPLPLRDQPRPNRVFQSLPPRLKKLNLPVEDTSSLQLARISPGLRWSTCLFRDPNIYRPTEQESKDYFASSTGRSLLTRWMNVLKATIKPPSIAFSDQQRPILLKNHPITHVLPRRATNDLKRRVFIEECLGVLFWPRQLQRKEAKEQIDDYGERDLGDNDFLVMKYEWPTANEVAPPCRLDLEDFPDIDRHHPRRIYLKREPTQRETEKVPPDLLHDDIFPTLDATDQPRPNAGPSRRYPQPDEDDSDDGIALMGGPLPKKTQAATFVSPNSQLGANPFSYLRFASAIRDSRILPKATMSGGASSQSSSNHVPTPSRNSSAVANAANPRRASDDLSQPLGKGLASVTGNGNPQERAPSSRISPQEREGATRRDSSSRKRPRDSRSRSPRRNHRGADNKGRPGRCSPAPSQVRTSRGRSPQSTTGSVHSEQRSLDHHRGRQPHRVQSPESATHGLKSLWQARGLSLSPSHPLLAGSAAMHDRDPPLDQMPARRPSQCKPVTKDVTMTDVSQTSLKSDAMDICPPLERYSPPRLSSAMPTGFAADASAPGLQLSSDLLPNHEPDSTSKSPPKTRAMPASCAPIVESRPSGDSMDLCPPPIVGPSPPTVPSALPTGVASVPPDTAATGLQLSSDLLPNHEQATMSCSTAHAMPTTSSAPTIEFWMQQDLVVIREGRLRASAYAAHRLGAFSAVTGQSSHVVAAQLRHSKSSLRVICYPMRFEGVVLSAETPLSIIEGFLSITRSHLGDIVLMSASVEGDKSATVDVGFRFADDALTAWQQDGFQHDGHFWKITPILSVRGNCFLIKPPGGTPRSKMDRIQKLRSALELESRIQACAVTDPITDVVSAQMQEVLDQLNTINVESAVVPSSGSYPCLSQDDTTLCAKIDPMAQPSDWTIVPGADMMAWMQTWTLPYKPRPAVASLSSRSRQRARKATMRLDSAPATGPASSTSEDAQSPAELHQALRATRRAATQKFDFWHIPGGEIQLPALPVEHRPEDGQPRDRNLIYKDIWRWHDDSLLVIHSAYASSGLNSSQDARPNLSQLPRVSTANQREATVRKMAYATLMEAFSPPERLRLLSGQALTDVMTVIGGPP